MANPLSKISSDVKGFAKGDDMHAVTGGIGAVVGVLAVPYTPQLTFLGTWAKLSNLLYGIALLAIGVWVKHDGLGFFLVGAGVAYFVDGLVRLAIPSVAASTTYAPAAEIATMYPVSASTYSGQVLYNG